MKITTRIGVFLSLVLLLAACGGGNSDVVPDPYADYTEYGISGTIFSPSLSSISVKSLDDSIIVTGEKTVDTNGHFSIRIKSSIPNPALLISAEGVNTNNIPDALEAVVFPAEEQSQSDVTPLTTTVTQILYSRHEKPQASDLNQLLAELEFAGIVNPAEWTSIDATTINNDQVTEEASTTGYLLWAQDIAADFEDLNLTPRNMLFFPDAHGGIQAASFSNGSFNQTVLSKTSGDIAIFIQPEDLRQQVQVEVISGNDVATAGIQSSGPILTLNAENQNEDINIPYELRLINTRTGKGRLVSGDIQVLKSTEPKNIEVGSQGARLISNDGNLVVDIPTSQATALTQIGIAEVEGTRQVYRIEVTPTELGQIPKLVIRGKNSLTKNSESAANTKVSTGLHSREIVDVSSTCKDSFPNFKCVNAYSAFFSGSEKHRVPIDDPTRMNSKSHFLFGGNLEYCTENKICTTIEYDISSELQRFSSPNIPTAGKPPVILINGYNKQGIKGNTQLGGAPRNENDEEGTWADLAEALAGDGMQPYLFRWGSNQRFEDVANELDSAIRKVNRDTLQKVHLIAHSFGGVLVRTLIQGIGQQFSTPNEKRIASITTIGTPHWGLADGGFHGGHLADFLCGQITCHQLGKRIFLDFPGGDSKAEWASLYGISEEEGALSKALHDTEKSKLPNIPINVAIGLKRYPPNDGPFPVGLWPSDGLISLKGQRFYAEDSRESSALQVRSLDQPVEEFLIGVDPLSTGYQISDSLELDSSFGYSHTNNSTLVIQRGKILGKAVAEVAITKDQITGCNPDKPGPCHGTYKILQKVLPLNSSSPDLIADPTDVPAAPVDLHAHILDGRFDISWDFVEDAESYQVLIASEQGLLETELDRFSSFDVFDGNRFVGSVPNGGIFYVKVRAINRIGIGPLSEEIGVFDPTASVSGKITDNESGLPIPDAKIVLDLDGSKTNAVSDINGDYYFELPAQFERLIVLADADGYVRQSINVNGGDATQFEHRGLSIALKRGNDNIVYPTLGADLIHLGDNNFGGAINSQFQRNAQGTAIDIPITIDARYFSEFTQAHFTLTVRGAQELNRILINGVQFAKLQESPANGSFGNYTFDLPIENLYEGENTLRIESFQNSSSDFDDFEFTNERIEFSIPAAGPTNLNGKLLRQNDKWLAEISISTLVENNKSANINFKELNCGGDLFYLYIEDGGYAFDEKISYGSCIQDCKIWIKSDGSEYKEFCNGTMTGFGNLEKIQL